jgi:SAM-dependent methyltransferase
MKMMEIMKEYDLFHISGNINPGSTDKGASNKVDGHSYIQNFYGKEFEIYKNKKIKILEIGIFQGGSIKLWKEYFSKAKEIIGVDITNEHLHPKHLNIDGVSYEFGDAYDPEFSKIFPNDFDIIIDDGPHSLDSQITSIQLYLPKLKKDGTFIVEDVQEDFWFESFINEAEKIYENDDSNVEYVVECLDFRDTLGRYDDMLFVVKKI